MVLKEGDILAKTISHIVNLSINSSIVLDTHLY